METTPYTQSGGPVGPPGAADGPCTPGTNDLGTYPNAHSAGVQVTVRLCEVPSIKNSSPYDSHDPEIFRSTTANGIIVNAGASESFHRMGEAALAAGVQLRGKGIRSYEKQQYFYNCYTTCSCNNCNLAARPGNSQHEYGQAIDFQGPFGWLKANARNYNICATVASEDWHYAIKDSRRCYWGS
jgi:hypothetical protein